MHVYNLTCGTQAVISITTMCMLNSPKANSATSGLRAEFALGEFSTRIVGCWIRFRRIQHQCVNYNVKRMRRIFVAPYGHVIPNMCMCHHGFQYNVQSESMYLTTCQTLCIPQFFTMFTTKCIKQIITWFVNYNLYQYNRHYNVCILCVCCKYHRKTVSPHVGIWTYTRMPISMHVCIPLACTTCWQYPHHRRPGRRKKKQRTDTPSTN
jgi:hypothetical protein